MNTPEKKLHPVNVRMTDTMRDELREIARQENRTVSNLIVTVMQKWLDDHRKFRESLDETSPEDR